MIVSIDEFGDFDPKSDRYNFFVATLINQEDEFYSLIKKNFHEWKDSISKEKWDKNNEVKGRDLNCSELDLFVQKVISDKKAPISFLQIRIKPNDNDEELIEKFRQIEIKKIEKLIDLSVENGFKKNAEQYRQLIKWYNKRNKHQYLKILLLTKIIPPALEKAIGVSLIYSHYFQKDKNLMNIKFLIDMDFINPDGHARLYFGELLRQAFYSYTKEHPIPILETWKTSGHPFMDKYIVNGRMNAKEILRDNLLFLESHENFEIQIADILCTIVNKYHNQDKCKEAYKKLLDAFPKKSTLDIVEIRLNPDFDENTDIEIIY
jgi:hypothetical protein